MGDKKSGSGDAGGSPEKANWPGLLVLRDISIDREIPESKLAVRTF